MCVCVCVCGGGGGGGGGVSKFVMHFSTLKGYMWFKPILSMLMNRLRYNAVRHKPCNRFCFPSMKGLRFVQRVPNFVPEGQIDKNK